MKEVKQVLVYGDGVHDDTEALQKVLDSEAQGIYPDGTTFQGL